MCRFLAYLGTPVILDTLLYQSKNSLVHQSFHAQEIKEPLNGDGFGMGWYNPSINELPAVYTSSMPAWSDRNLRHLASKVSSPSVFAHVRAASMGSVSQLNCQPFHYKNYLLMHNGEIAGFSQIKRNLRRNLSDEIYEWIEGETDSEHFFSLFLDRLLKKDKTPEVRLLSKTLIETIAELEELKAQHGVQQSSSLNIVITDGHCLVGVRYISDGYDKNPPTLYYSSGNLCTCKNGISHKNSPPSDQALSKSFGTATSTICHKNSLPSDYAVLVVSEKLTDNDEDWNEVPPNHLIEVNKSLSVRIESLPPF